jgi:hypothetical protein
LEFSLKFWQEQVKKICRHSPLFEIFKGEFSLCILIVIKAYNKTLQLLANFFDWDSSFKTCLQPGLGAKKVEKHCVRALSISYNFGFK